jgi:polysaccharide pyruvyl transferase WcaK-like protein
MDVSVEHAREQAILIGLKEFIKKHSEVILRFFIFNDHPIYSDKKVTQEITEALPKTNIEIDFYSDNPYRVLNKIAECQAFFAIRLHAAIFSFISAIPFALVEYHRKCEDFLNEIGHDDALRLKRNVSDPGKINDILCRLMEMSENNKHLNLKNKIQEFQSLSLRNFQEAPFYKCIRR